MNEPEKQIASPASCCTAPPKATRTTPYWPSSGVAIDRARFRHAFPAAELDSHHSSAPALGGLKTPSPEQPFHKRQDSVHHPYSQPPMLSQRPSYSSSAHTSYTTDMNNAQHMQHHAHYSNASDPHAPDNPHSHATHASVGSAAHAQGYYSSYAPHAPAMHPGLSYAAAAPMANPAYGAYLNGPAPVANHLLNPHARGQQTTIVDSEQGDTTGQVAPAGYSKPRVTATLWEDEATLCFQIETAGICVARRDDNHMINGTKLLNVAGMTRGRRDGMLKSEKNRTVVKIGPMHLKGVWIPFDRALELANKEKITERLYPLFVHNLNGLIFAQQTNPSACSGIITTTGSLAARPPTDDYPTPSSTMHPASAPSSTPQMGASNALGHRPIMGSRSTTMPNQPPPQGPWSDYTAVPVSGPSTAPDTPRGYTHSAHSSYGSAYGTMPPPMRLGAAGDGSVAPVQSQGDGHEAEYVHTTGPYAQQSTAAYGAGASAPRTAYNGRAMAPGSLHSLMSGADAQPSTDVYLPQSSGAGQSTAYGGSGTASPDLLKRKRALDDETSGQRSMAVPGKR